MGVKQYVIPIFERGDNLNPNNYRGINLLISPTTNYRTINTPNRGCNRIGG